MTRWITAVAALALTMTLAMASPLKVRTLETKSQMMMMCAACERQMACARAGDYTISFDVDLANVKTGAATMAVHVKDKAGKPVEDATVVVNLTMPEHRHTLKPLTSKHTGHGRYLHAAHLASKGVWRAVVNVTLADGERVKQSFAFRN